MLGLSLRKAASLPRRWVAAPLARTGVSPQALTLASVPLAAGSGALILTGRHAAGALILGALALLMDFVDGEVARLQGRTTPFGNLLDAVVDRVVEALLLSALARGCPVAACSALGASLLASYIKARVGLVIVADNRDWPGVGDRADRALLLLVAIGVGGWSLLARAWLLWGLALMAAIGCVQRLTFARALVTRAEQDNGLLPYLRRQD